MSSEYPKREQFFAHRFIRLLTKTAAAQAIGPEACWLLAIIAMLEDTKRYTGPVLFWNDALMGVCGFGGRRRLVGARKKAVEAGWLHYRAGGKGVAGEYWVEIPERFADLPDESPDETPTECRSETERQTTGQNDLPFQNGTLSARTNQNAVPKRNDNRTPFLPKPKDKESAPKKRFVKPTVEQVRVYCLEKKYSIDPEQFFNFYESNGWKVGKNSMKKWKSAIAGWETRNGNKAKSQSTGPAVPSDEDLANYGKTNA